MQQLTDSLKSQGDTVGNIAAEALSHRLVITLM